MTGRKPRSRSTADQALLDAYRAELGWALDLLDDYDVHLLEHGDNPMEVYSPHHVERKRKIRQMLDEEP